MVQKTHFPAGLHPAEFYLRLSLEQGSLEGGLEVWVPYVNHSRKSEGWSRSEPLFLKSVVGGDLMGEQVSREEGG